MDSQQETSFANKMTEQPKLSAREQKFLEYQKSRQIFDNVKKNIDLTTQERDRNLFMINLNDQIYQKKNAQMSKLDILKDSKGDTFLREILEKRANPEEDDKPLVTRQSTNLTSYITAHEQGEPSLLSNLLNTGKNAPQQKVRSISRGNPINRSREELKSISNISTDEHVSKQNILNDVNSFSFKKVSANMLNTAPQVDTEGIGQRSENNRNKSDDRKDKQLKNNIVNHFSFHIDPFSESEDGRTLTKDDQLKVLKAQLDIYKSKYHDIKEKFKTIGKDAELRSKSQKQAQILEQRVQFQSDKIQEYKRFKREAKQKIQSVIQENNILTQQLQASDYNIKQQVKLQVSKTQAKYSQLLNKLQSDLDFLLDKNARLTEQLNTTQENEQSLKKENERLQQENFALFESNGTFLKKIQDQEAQIVNIKKTEYKQQKIEYVEVKKEKKTEQIHHNYTQVQESLKEIASYHNVQIKQLKFQLRYTTYAFIIFAITIIIFELLS